LSVQRRIQNLALGRASKRIRYAEEEGVLQ
jgi:hypothetical protein